MTSLSNIISRIVEKLDDLDLKRETILRDARLLNRISGRGIALILQNEDHDQLLSEGAEILKKIKLMMVDLANVMSWNSIASEVEEYSEFAVLSTIIKTGNIMSPENTDIPDNIWLTSLGDVVGELRRITLKNLIDDNYTKAVEFHKIMNEISYIMRGLMYSKTLVPNLRRKIDMVRAVTEKTDSDITNALIFQKMNLRLGTSKNEQ